MALNAAILSQLSDCTALMHAELLSGNLSGELKLHYCQAQLQLAIFKLILSTNSKLFQP
jgi:hypothetical protein